ncbi:PstS family phosphate ABC transporter substrate-binding protein [Gallaecimonas sp. GXIMD1310]|uniref:PstS family phosphate ABC transporter substrate-binding protein n=1 Tax=Gallaecimonas sp. GXIMD1310 TaxID=3131926 RepID=UPI0032551220
MLLVTAVQAAPLPPYQRVDGIAGNMSSVGSDTLANLMTLWAEAFKRQYPNVNIQIQAAGSSTAPPALTEGTAQFGPMSRPMKRRERDAFEKHYGYPPIQVPVAIDALAVYVNQDNPIKGLTLRQVDSLFSATLRCGGQPISRWGQLGLQGDWARRSIQLYGRNSVSGTYGYFKEKALCNGDFKNKVNEQPGSASVIQSVSASLNAVGYSGIGYRTSGVRALPLSLDGQHYVSATAANAISGQYPLSRYLYIYINKPPGQPLAPLQAEFLKLVLSKTGQQLVARDGYVALPAAIVHQQRQRLGLD